MFSLATHMWKKKIPQILVWAMATISGSKINFFYPGAKRQLKYFLSRQMEFCSPASAC